MIRIERLELFDEFEEWHMMQASNALIPAMKDSKLLLLINKMIWFRSARLYQIVISSHTHKYSNISGVRPFWSTCVGLLVTKGPNVGNWEADILLTWSCELWWLHNYQFVLK